MARASSSDARARKEMPIVGAGTLDLRSGSTSIQYEAATGKLG
jgi:hypothetical protein